MDRVNRDLRNAEVAFNQAEQVANEAADADRKAILEQNATAILLVSWTQKAQSRPRPEETEDQIMARMRCCQMRGCSASAV
ncbi:hypothetical protein OOU_Y34scaffold01039g5 [Pyricularia oryzae Y34]|uniref:Uncharacterized protein n=1 Tax=Pyricularia oryzae (strain Y34) TaxID=1143189 RepID=A0AA97NM94_PYRO3|nr:hypothetical protein OOU_Y34scaffold01039g5 [Pyricularia oryzae Y34]